MEDGKECMKQIESAWVVPSLVLFVWWRMMYPDDSLDQDTQKGNGWVLREGTCSSIATLESPIECKLGLNNQ